MLEKAGITGVTHSPDEAVYRVEGRPPTRLFSDLAEAGITVDAIVQTERDVLFSVPLEDATHVPAVLERTSVRWTARDDLARVSVVGVGIKADPAIPAKTYAALGDAGVEPIAVTSSPIRISFHIRRADADRAVQALHDAFELGAVAPEAAHA